VLARDLQLAALLRTLLEQAGILGRNAEVGKGLQPGHGFGGKAAGTLAAQNERTDVLRAAAALWVLNSFRLQIRDVNRSPLEDGSPRSNPTH